MRRLRSSLSAVLAIALAPLAVALVAPAAQAATDPNYADIVINEVTSNNTGSGYAPIGDADDLIELYNKGTSTVDLTGWKQFDSGAAGFASATDFSGGLYVNGVLATSIPAGGYGVFSSAPGLSGGGDAVKVWTPDGILVDSITWTAGQAGSDSVINQDNSYKALASCPNGGDTVKEVTTPSFGADNTTACATGVTPLVAADSHYADIVINEVTSNNTGNGFAPLDADDLIELYNKGTSAVSLAGWKQFDSGAGNFASATAFSGGLYVNGALATSIPAGGYGVFSSGPGLSGGGDAVKIYSSAGTLVDSITWTDGQAGTGTTVNTAGTYKSLASCPNGGDTVLMVPTTSFGADNTTACASGVTPITAGGGSGGTLDPNYADIVINEVTSNNSGNGFAPLDADDLIELYNKGTHTVSLSGWKQFDSGAAGYSGASDFSGGLYVNGVLATSIPAGGYGVFSSTPGLSSGGDAVKIWGPDGTPVDSITWTAGQAGVDETVNTAGTYKALASCPNGGDTVLEVPNASFGADNTTACAGGITPLTSPGTGPEAACDTENSGTAPGTVPADVVAWPGSQTPATIDGPCAWVTTLSGQDLSGLAFDPNDANVLYAVKNKSHVWRLVRSGGSWVKDTTNGWSAGKDIRFPAPNTTGLPDSEGLTVGPDGALYITTERDNAASGIPLDSILRFDPTASGTTLVATDQWVLTSDLGFTNADANLGFEGVAFVPDSFLTGAGFRTDDGSLYDPAAYPNKAVSGLFLGAVEKTGHLRAYVLNTDHSWTRVADISTGMVGVMDATYDADLGRVWAHCDNTCGNATTLMKIGSDGHFAVDRSYSTPTGLPNYNLEGFAVAPYSTGTSGTREVLWADDGNRFGHSLWSGTLSLDLGLAQVATPTPIIVGAPTAGETLTASIGTWDAGVTTHYVWKDGSTVLATDGPLVLTDAMVGRTITLAVTGTKAGFSDTTKTATTPVTAATLSGPSPTIAGSPVFGQTLTANVGAWGSGVTTHYVWEAGGSTLATDAPLVLSDPGLVGRTVTLTVTGTKSGYAPASRSASTTVAPGSLTAPAPTISGTPKIGETLTASAAWGPGSVDLDYTWLANGSPIAGADGPSLDLGATQVGKTITVRVTGTKAGYSTATATSSPTDKVAAGTLTSERPSIDGKAKVGKTLTADPGAWSAGGAPVTLKFKWFADGKVIKGATSDSLDLTKKLKGDQITVTVTGSADGYETSSRTSKATAKVT